MNRIAKFIAVVVCFLAVTSIFSQKISNKGKDFWVGYGHHQFMETPTDNSMNMTIYLSVEDLPAGLTYATVTVTIDSSGLTPALWWTRTYHIAKNTVISIDNNATPAFSFSPLATKSWGPIPKGPVDAAASNTAPSFDARLYSDPCPAGTGGFGLFRKKGIHITSDVDIVAYSHIYGSVSSGATMLLPTTSWGYSYTTINSRQGDATGAYNFFYVLAKENNTKVRITGSKAPRYKPGCTFVPPAAGVPFYVTLNKGQIYQYVGDANANGDGVQLTGSRVESVPNSLGECKKIAVFAGSSRTSGESDGGCTSSSRDNDMQQCFPEHTWGKRYLTTPFASASGTTLSPNVFAGTSYKIVCQDTGTRVRINGGPIININLGSFYQFTNSTPNYIESNKPIMVGQFMTSGNCATGQGDPAVVYLSPLEQAIPKVGLYRNTMESITANYVNIVVPDAGYNSLRIDNQGPPNFGGNSATVQVLNYAGSPGLTGYKMVVKGWPATRSQTLIKCDTSFNVITYGLGGAESYAYNGGAYFNNLRAVSNVYNSNDTTKNQDSINVKGHNQAYYSNQVASPVLLRLLANDHAYILSWNFSQTIDTNKVTIVNKRTGLVNKNVIDFHPKALDSSMINNKWTNFKYQCPDTMLLYRKVFNGSLAPLQLDTFYVPVTIHSIDSAQLYTAPVNSCNGSFGSLGDTVVLNYSSVYGGGVTIVANVPPCLTIPATFTAPDSVKYGVLSEKIVKWFWEFENGATDSVQNPIHKLTQPLNLIYLTVTTASGLKVQTSISATASTTIKYSAPERVCVNQPIQVVDSTIWTNKDSCIWNFGDGTRILDLNCSPQTHTYTTPGTYTIWHKLSLGGSTCVLDSVPKTIIVSSKRYPVIDYTNPCADSAGIANFNANLGVGGVPIKDYLWNFGQISSGAFDSSKVNPAVHNYGVEGDFLVKLNVIDSLGCLGDTTQTIAIKIKPNIFFKPLPVKYCINAGNISFASLAGCYNQSKVLGTGVFSGPGIDAAGNFDPMVAGVGMKTIWYVYSTSKGCKDSIARQINVLDKPVVAFDYTQGCLPKSGVAQFSNLTNLGFSFIWNFDDALNSNSSNPNIVDSINPSHIYANTGVYNVKLYSETANGCKDSLTKTITFSVTPNVKFTALSSVCENATNVNVAFASVVNGVLGTGSYFGNGTTTAGVLSPAVSGWGNQNITYVFTSTGNCIDSASQAILVKARPKIGFSYPAGCLPANGIVKFTDTTKISDGQTIQSCGWTFGDPNATVANPNTASICSPSHNFNYGTYTIYHTVTSSLGCITDTTFTANFSVSPDLFFNAIAPVCENLTIYSISNAGSNNLIAAPGTGVYQGTGIVNANTGDFNPSVAGPGTHEIYYVFTATSGCVAIDTQTVLVKARPRGGFTFTPNTGCLNAAGLVQFSNNISVQGSSVQSYNWQFETPSTVVNGTSPTYNYNDGTYIISLNVQANNGCSFDTSMSQTFSKTPALSPLVQADICENGGVFTLTAPSVTNGAIGTGVFSSFKNAVTNVATGTYDPSIAGYGVDTIYYTFTSTGGCIASVKTAINIKARPRGSFTFTPNTGCLNAAGLVQFSNNISVQGSTVQSYNWQFETPSSVVNGTSPTYNYNDGTYTISLNVQANNGCSFDTSMSQTFSKTPALSPLVQADICENGGVVTLTAPSVTNGAIGTGVFSSFKNAVTNVTTGTYDPSIAGYGVDTIYYTFTSTGGCIASVKTAINIKARPRGGFTFTPNTGCLNAAGLVQFSNNISVQGSSVQSYNWQFETPSSVVNGTSPTYNYNDGTYTISLNVQANNGCSFDTSMSQTFSKTPALSPLVQADICENGGVVTLTAPSVTNGAIGTGVFSSFKNAVTNVTTGTYDPSIAGYGVDTIYYTFTSSSALGCATTVKTAVNIKARPRGGFTFAPNTGCLNTAGFVQFNNNIFVLGSSVQSYNWQFETPSTVVNGSAPTHNYNDGTYTISLNVIGANGCSFDTSMSQTFSKTPALSPLVQAAICENGGAVTLTAPSVTNGAIGTGVFSSFKNAVTNATTGTYDPSIAGYGIDTLYYTFTSTGGCIASVKTAVNIKARPRGQFSFTPNTGCLDVTGLVKFNAGGISVPGSFVQTYNWQFENTLPLVSGGSTPTHSYNDGTYDIKLNAIGFNGCSFDTMMTQKFSRTPSLDPIVLANVCANSSAFILNAPAVNNGVTGNAGVFSSLKNAIVNNTTYDPAIAGYSIDTVYYTFTSNNGCAATVKKVVNIFPVPKAAISVKPDVCIDSTLTFKDFSTLASGTISTRNWNFGDGSLANINPPGNIITHGFANTQTYTIHLTVTTDSGCIAMDSVNVTVRPKPKAQFEFNPVVCMPNGTAFFTNQSSLAANGGNLSYVWTFGDPNANAANPNISNLKDPKHLFATIQQYPIKLVVTSVPYNCSDIYTDTLYPKGPFINKPIAKFGLSKDTLCENEPTLFTDSSFAPNSSLFSWTWYYGDGTTPNTTTVPYSLYAYPVADTFRAALTVRNTELCESDPYYLKVLVYPQPQIDSMKEIIVPQNTVLQFNPTVSDSVGIKYWWTAFLPPYSVAGLSNPDSLRPYLNATESQIYVLNALGKGQCMAQRIQSVKVLGKIVIPNAFSPNGDGINDTWKITSLGDYPGATLDIFDRYGMKVKHLEGNMEWNGTVNGSPLPVATYYYIINPGNGVAQITGWVVLVR